jgi:hypothetical protein
LFAIAAGASMLMCLACCAIWVASLWDVNIRTAAYPTCVLVSAILPVAWLITRSDEMPRQQGFPVQPLKQHSNKAAE